MPPDAVQTEPSRDLMAAAGRGGAVEQPPASPPDAEAAAPAPHPLAWRWAAAAFLGAAAIALRAALDPWLQGVMPFVFAFPALAAAALLAGAGPALLTLVVTALLPLLPALQPMLGNELRAVHVLSFAVAGAVVIMACDRLRRPAAPAAAPTLAAGEQATLDDEGRSVQLWLRVLMVMALLLPAAFFLSTAWQSHARAMADATARINRSAVLAREHGLRLVNMNNLVLQQLHLRLDGWSAAQIDGRRSDLQATLAGMVTGLPDVRGLAVWDASGRLLLAAGQLETADRPAGVAGQDYFDVHREGGVGVYLSTLPRRADGSDGQVVVTERRSTMAGDFDGVYGIVLDAGTFERFYRDLLRTEHSGAVSLLRADGRVLVRQPEAPLREPKLAADRPLLKRWRAGDTQGVAEAVSPFDNTLRLLAFRRLDPQPLFVVASLRKEEIVAAWYRELGLLAAFTFPTALGLAWVSWLALRHIGRERAAMQRWRAETVKRTQAEDALRQTQRLEALGHLTGGVAHDVNNLLMVVSNNAYLLRRVLAGAPALQRAEKPIDAILRAVTNGSRLTRQLLAFSRRQALRPQAVRLQDQLPQLLDLIRHSISSTITLDGDCAPDTGTVLVDPAELELALINLAVNARDAMPQGGHLQLSMRNAEPGEHQGLGRWVSITMSDTGVGIPRALLDRVFEPFFTTKEQGKGTGLGLSQVYGFCQQAGGTVRIDSQPGEGTRVQLLLPAAAPEEAAMPAMVDEAPAPAAEGRLLLVEDNAEVADATEPMLSTWGYAVRSARSGDAAREVLAQAEGRFDLLLTDIVMPGSTDGLSLARHVRQRYPHIGMVLMTGHARETDKAIAEGFVVLQKPWTPSDLRAALEEAHPRRRTEQA
jgi:two-component system NtrC family sensor kinase